MFSRSYKIFTLLGFDIKIDPSWLLIAALIVWSLSTGYFPDIVVDQTQATYLTLAIIAMLGLFASLILHELAHSVIARRYGVEIKGITLFVFGGIAELGSEPKTAGSEFWIAVAGPAMSFALAGGFWVVGLLVDASNISQTLAAVLSYLALINLILALFNLLPAFPLDGGRVYRAILWNRSGNFLDATRRASQLGGIFAYVLIGMGLLSLFGGQQMGGLWQVFIGLFLLAAAKSTYQQQVMKSAFENKTVASMMTPDPTVTSPDQSLAELVNQIMLRHRTSFVPVVEEGVLLGYVDGDVVSRIDRENWSNTRVGDVFVELDKTNTISSTLPAGQVLEKITAIGRRKFLVAQGHRLLGVITLSDLMGYLAVLHEVTDQNNSMGQGIKS